MPQSLSLGYVEDNTLKGYGVIKKTITGYRAGPLYADNIEIAQ